MQLAVGLMMSRPPNWRFNLEWLVKQSRDQIASVRTGLSELLSHRYVVRVQVLGERGRFVGYEYLVSDTPVTTEDVERFHKEVASSGLTIVRFSEDGESDDGKSEVGKSNTNNMEGNKTDSTNTETRSSAPQKARDVDPSQLLPSSELMICGAVSKKMIDPMLLESQLEGDYLFSFRDLRSRPAAEAAAATLITASPKLWRWLVDLRLKGSADTKTFRTYPEDVLAHVDTFGVERVEAALKYTVQKPDCEFPWGYFLDRVARDVTTPPPSTDRASSNKFSGRGGRRGTQAQRDYHRGAERLRQKYSDA